MEGIIRVLFVVIYYLTSLIIHKIVELWSRSWLGHIEDMFIAWSWVSICFVREVVNEGNWNFLCCIKWNSFFHIILFSCIRCRLILIFDFYEWLELNCIKTLLLSMCGLLRHHIKIFLRKWSFLGVFSKEIWRFDLLLSACLAGILILSAQKLFSWRCLFIK